MKNKKTVVLHPISEEAPEDNKNEFCFGEHKVDVMIGTAIVYLLMIIMVGAVVIWFDLLFKTSIREWLGEYPVAVFVVVFAGYPLLTEIIYHRWVNRCKRD